MNPPVRFDGIAYDARKGFHFGTQRTVSPAVPLTSLLATDSTPKGVWADARVEPGHGIQGDKKINGLIAFLQSIGLTFWGNK
jgi:hypothetical protein